MASLTATFQIPSWAIWNTGYQATVTISNNGTAASANWTTSFSLPSGQKMGNAWNCLVSYSGSKYIVRNASWNGVIAPGGSTSYGFVGTLDGSNAPDLLGFELANEGTGVPAVPVLNSPQSSTDGTQVELTWEAVSTATSYLLQISSVSDFSIIYKTYSTSNTSYTLSALPAGLYYFRVAAVNEYGTGQFSTSQSLTIAAPVLTAPSLNPVNNNGLYNFNLSWSTVPGAQGYNLEQSHDASFSTPIKLYTGPTTSYSVFRLSQGDYWYRVNAYSGNVNGPYSATLEVTVSQSPPAIKAFAESYWESWSSDSITAITSMKLNILDIAFITFNSLGNNEFSITGPQTDPASLSQFISDAHAQGKKVKVSVGGATFPLSGILTSAQAAQGMAQALANFVNSNSLDGVDFDIEDYPSIDNQVALISATRALLPDALISYTSKTPASLIAPYDQLIPLLVPYISYVSLMCYDSGSNLVPNYTGPASSSGYSYVLDVEGLIKLGVPASHICLGFMPGTDDMGVMTTLQYISDACTYVLQNGLAGVMYWDANRDLTNITGLGAQATAEAIYSILQ